MIERDVRVIESFVEKFIECPMTGCYLWMAGENSWGYGTFRCRPAHRVSYELFVGKIPEGLEIDHLCRNRLCVAPNHLEAVTHLENVRRGKRTKRDTTPRSVAKMRFAVCRKGHEKAGSNLYARPDGTGYGCVICRREAMRNRPRHARNFVGLRRGERHHQAKLTEENVLEVRGRFAQGERKVDLAIYFDVSQTLIGDIISRRIWTHI